MKKTLKVVGFFILGITISSVGGSVGGDVGNLLTIVGFVGMIIGIVSVFKKK